MKGMSRVVEASLKGFDTIVPEIFFEQHHFQMTMIRALTCEICNLGACKLLKYVEDHQVLV